MNFPGANQSARNGCEQKRHSFLIEEMSFTSILVTRVAHESSMALIMHW